MIFNNPLLEDEISDIFNNDFPDHTTLFAVIIHSEEEDYYPQDIFTMDIVRDYDSKLTDNIVISMLMTKDEFNRHIFNNRDDLQITLVIDYNGKIHKERMKALLVTNPDGRMLATRSEITGMNADEHTMIDVEIQCISFLYSVLKDITSNGVMRGDTLDNVIRHYLSSEMEQVVINSQKVEPIIDLVDIHNSRAYNNIIINDNVTLLDIPTYLQKEYGLYNGGIGTYVYNNGLKDVITIFPLYNSEVVSGERRLITYVPDKPMAADITNKTVVLDGDNLRVIVTSLSKRVDKGFMSDYTYGYGFKSVNSNQVLDRTMEKDGDVVSSDSTKSIDSIGVESKAGLASAKKLPDTDNLYAVRSEFLRARSVMVSMQWNFSRPDLLIPGMGVDIVRTEEAEVIREKGTLISSYSKYDNTQRCVTTLLNVLVNI